MDTSFAGSEKPLKALKAFAACRELELPQAP